MYLENDPKWRKLSNYSYAFEGRDMRGEVSSQDCFAMDEETYFFEKIWFFVEAFRKEGGDIRAIQRDDVALMVTLQKEKPQRAFVFHEKSPF